MRIEWINAGMGDAYEATLDCESCGAFSRGSSYAKARTISFVLPLGDTEEASQDAMFRARERVALEAQKQAELAPCPRCGRRNRAAIVDCFLIASLPLLGAAISLFFWLVDRSRQPGMAWWQQGALMFFGVWWLLRMIKVLVRWRRSTSRVQLAEMPRLEDLRELISRRKDDA